MATTTAKPLVNLVCHGWQKVEKGEYRPGDLAWCNECGDFRRVAQARG